MADLAPIKERLAKCIRLFGSAERANARNMTERTLVSIGASWSDLGNWIENGGMDSEGKYTETEMQEFSLAIRKQGVEEGIKIGMARAQAQQQSNGHIVLPEPSEMAEYCHQQPNRLKDDAQRKFIDEMHVKTRAGINLKRGTLGYLASIYIKLGGRI
jgi:hypothetical protein